VTQARASIQDMAPQASDRRKNGMKQPQERQVEPVLDRPQPPTWTVVTWMSEELRERIRRRGVVLGEMHLSRDTPFRDTSFPVRAADPQLEDREAEP